MTREIKFEYLFKEKYSNKLHRRVFTLEQLEDYEMDVFKLESSWEIVARRQFTGLHDKNGKECYEKDRVKTPAGVGMIEWMDGCYWICWPNNTGKTTLHDIPKEMLEIAGNEYEGDI